MLTHFRIPIVALALIGVPYAPHRAVTHFPHPGPALAAQSSSSAKNGEAASAFRPLFNGTDTKGWHGVGPDGSAASAGPIDRHWSVAAGELVTDGFGTPVASDQPVGDVELTLEFKTGGAATTDVFIRAGQIPIEPQGRAADSKWHALRVIQVGEIVSVFVDGARRVDHERVAGVLGPGQPLPRSGSVALRGRGDEVRFRKVAYRDVSASEALQFLRDRDRGTFKRIFDGKSLNGWKGAVDQYEVVDGAIRCKAGSGGNLFTKDEYGDFTVRFEVKLPPGGNNGLAIRYPGEGDTAYVGMCELQVLDDSDPKYATLDTRQYHGSIYGMVAAHRGYQRPVGEWNFEQVTVVGSRITVELNGTVITDGDVSTVTQFLDDKAHPGKDRKRGYFRIRGAQRPCRVQGCGDSRGRQELREGVGVGISFSFCHSYWRQRL